MVRNALQCGSIAWIRPQEELDQLTRVNLPGAHERRQRRGARKGQIQLGAGGHAGLRSAVTSSRMAPG